MRILTGPIHYGRETEEHPFGWRELVTRAIICVQRKLRTPLALDLSGDESSDALVRGLAGSAPFLAARFGTGELEATLRGLAIRTPDSFVRKIWNVLRGATDPFWWDNSIRAGICNNAGVFPPTEETLQRFAGRVLDDVPQVDLLGCYSTMPNGFREKCFPKTLLCALQDLEPFWRKRPWTTALAGKRVLVVHSMTDSVALQYPKRRRLFANCNLLPDFELLTYRSVNSAMGLKTPFKDWFEALARMEDDIAKMTFDVALLGCGAYGMSLGAFVKRDLGRKAIHLGGMTQILFGIIGKRWEGDPRYAKLLNDAWIRPLASDTPRDCGKIEDGCYW